jgi:hypothetical protein
VGRQDSDSRRSPDGNPIELVLNRRDNRQMATRRKRADDGDARAGIIDKARPAEAETPADESNNLGRGHWRDGSRTHRDVDVRADVVSFDIEPPLQPRGEQRPRGTISGTSFRIYQRPLSYEIRDQSL